ncbi:hypothetical protein ES703_00682 [subsurface metagenome]
MKAIKEMAGALFGVAGLAIGGFAFGGGLKFTWYWWGDLPNFWDGIAWTLSSLFVICWFVKYCRSYLKRG